MFFGENLSSIAFMFMVAIAVGAMALALLYPMFVRTSTDKRVKDIAVANSGGKSAHAKGSFRQRMSEDPKDQRRKQVAESLKQVEDREKNRKKRLSLKTMISQAGLDLSVRKYWVISFIVALVFAVAPFLAGVPWYLGIGGFFVGLFGFPRWVIGYLRKRRQNKFLHDFADAIDVMVRGLRAGLPVTEAMRIIATEFGPPVGPEFIEVVEGQRVGISVDAGVERMVERMPLAEVNFLGIVMAIQAKTGGNLSEALSNLSKVLRDRKKMKAKVQAISQEAKSSAGIIGSLPFFIMGVLTVMNPSYLDPLWNTPMGQICVMVSGTWMTVGALVMRKMINFEI